MSLHIHKYVIVCVLKYNKIYHHKISKRNMCTSIYLFKRWRLCECWKPKEKYSLQLYITWDHNQQELRTNDRISRSQTKHLKSTNQRTKHFGVKIDGDIQSFEVPLYCMWLTQAVAAMRQKGSLSVWIGLSNRFMHKGLTYSRIL